MRPSMPSVNLSGRAKAAIWTVVALIVLLIIAIRLTGVYIDWLWFKHADVSNVFSTILWTRIILFAIFGVLMALIIGGNVAIAYLLRPPFRPMSTEQQNLERYRAVLEPRRRLVLGIICAIALLTAGMSAQATWTHWQLWLNGGSFGVKDPQFGKDISFYAWDYPVYRLMLNFGFTAIIFSILLVLVVHYLSGAIRLQTPGPKVTPHARRHLTILVFVFMVLKALAYWLDRYGLVFSVRSGKFTGASYTDVHAVLPARTILFWIAIVLALLVLASLWLRSALYPAIGFVVLIVLSIVISGIYPQLLQQLSVKPNANAKEAPYIRRNIDSTRQAYGVVTNTNSTPGNVNYIAYSPTAQPATNVLTPANPTVGDIRLLDPNVISPTVQQYQAGKNVYGFAPKLDMDHYTIDGKINDYVVGVRELDAANLAGNQTSWINSHTVYTHGYGFVAAQADKDVTTLGSEPGAYTEGGIPQTGPLNLTQPRSYFGEMLPDYSIVGSEGQPQEFDGNGDTKYRYDGGGGVPLGNIFTRLAFAVKYKQANFVLNKAASAKGASIIFIRNPRTMVQKAAPYLTVDSDPFPIVDESTGHIVWMLDAYTTMNNYPYSQRMSLSSLTSDSFSTTDKTAQQPNDSINYIRNSVKATVDAYTGKVTLYQWDTKDPVLKAWMKIFPGTVQPASSMPADVQAHVRYPEDLFEVQRAMLAAYHVDDPQIFYNASDKWTVPADPTAPSVSNQPPYYILASAPDGSATTAEYQLTTPMKVNTQTYLASYMSVDSEPGPNYGKITTLVLPPGSVVDGPEQVHANFNANQVISSDITLLSGQGSTPVWGNLLTMPIGDSFLYVEPLYVAAQTNGFPVLQRIVVYYGKTIGYAGNLGDALLDLSENPAQVGTTLNGGGTTTPPSNTTTPPSNTTTPPSNTTTPSSSPSSSPSGTPSSSNATQSQLLTQINSAYAALQTCQGPTQCASAQKTLNDLVSVYLTKYGPKH
jgi:uncharacterized membrane protein (UPF0182 family)